VPFAGWGRLKALPRGGGLRDSGGLLKIGELEIEVIIGIKGFTE